MRFNDDNVQFERKINKNLKYVILNDRFSLDEAAHNKDYRQIILYLTYRFKIIVIKGIKHVRGIKPLKQARTAK